MFKKLFKKEEYMEKVQFEIRLVHEEPIDLIQMANALIALNNISKSHISKEHGVRESNILLKGVKEGSDIYELALDLGAKALPLLDGVSTIKDIMGYINSYKNIDNKKIEDIREDRHYNSFEAEQIQHLIAPIINNDDNSKIEINVKGDVNAPINITINKSEAKTMKENANTVKKIVNSEEIEEESKTFTKVLIEMHKATKTQKKVKDSAYCDDIVKGKAIATIIDNDEDKKLILEDPFNNYFLVDIEIAKSNNEIKLYRVTKLHNIVPMDEA